jgi:hypothetical protein
MPTNWGTTKLGEIHSNDSDSTPLRRMESFAHTPTISRGGPISGVSHAKPKFCMITIEPLASADSDEDDLKQMDETQGNSPAAGGIE